MGIEVGSIVVGAGYTHLVALSKVKSTERNWYSSLVSSKRQKGNDILIPAGIITHYECYAIIGEAPVEWYIGECRRVIGKVDNRYLPTLKCFFEISNKAYRGW